MNLQTLLSGLTDPDANTRLQTARVIGMLDETAALDALAAQYRAETVQAVKDALAWAGRRAQAAKKSGYDTRAAIFEHFHIDYDVQAEQDAREARLLQTLEHDADMQLLRERRGKAGDVALGMVIGGALMGTQGMVMGAMAGLRPGADALSSSLEKRPHIGSGRIPPTRPDDTDIRMLVRRLLTDTNPDKRRKAAVDLGSISSNPAALPYLAQTFVEDADAAVREAAQRSARRLYWNAIYWDMEQSGAITAEIERRSAGTPPPEPPQTMHPAIRRIQPQAAPEQPPQPPLSVDLGEILRKADEKRGRQRKP